MGKRPREDYGYDAGFADGFNKGHDCGYAAGEREGMKAGESAMAGVMRKQMEQVATALFSLVGATRYAIVRAATMLVSPCQNERLASEVTGTKVEGIEPYSRVAARLAGLDESGLGDQRLHRPHIQSGNCGPGECTGGCRGQPAHGCPHQQCQACCDHRHLHLEGAPCARHQPDGTVTRLSALIAAKGQAVVRDPCTWLLRQLRTSALKLRPDTAAVVTLKGTLWFDAGHPFGTDETIMTVQLHDDGGLVLDAAPGALPKTGLLRLVTMKGGCRPDKLRQVVAPVLRAVVDLGMWGVEFDGRRIHVDVDTLLGDMEALLHACSKESSTHMADPWSHWARHKKKHFSPERKIGAWSVPEGEPSTRDVPYGHWWDVFCTKILPKRKSLGGTDNDKELGGFNARAGMTAMRPWLYCHHVKYGPVSPWAHDQPAHPPKGRGPSSTVPLYTAPDQKSEPEAFRGDGWDTWVGTPAELAWMEQWRARLRMQPPPLHTLANLIGAIRDMCAATAVCNSTRAAGLYEFKRRWCEIGRQPYYKQHWKIYNLRQTLCEMMAEHAGDVERPADAPALGTLLPPALMVTGHLLSDLSWGLKHNPTKGALPHELGTEMQPWICGLERVSVVLTTLQLWVVLMLLYPTTMGFKLHAFNLVPTLTSYLGRVPFACAHDEEAHEAQFGQQATTQKVGQEDLLRAANRQALCAVWWLKWEGAIAQKHAHARSASARRVADINKRQTIMHPVVPVELRTTSVIGQPGQLWAAFEDATEPVLGPAGLEWAEMEGCLTVVPTGESAECATAREAARALCRDTRAAMNELMAGATVTLQRPGGNAHEWHVSDGCGGGLLCAHSSPKGVAGQRSRRFALLLACMRHGNPEALAYCYGKAPFEASEFGGKFRAREEDLVLAAWHTYSGTTTPSLPKLPKLVKLAEHLGVTVEGGAGASRKAVIRAMAQHLRGPGASARGGPAEDDISDDEQDGGDGHDM